MPSRDDDGKRLSGAQQRARAQRLAAGLPPELPAGPPKRFASVTAPPMNTGVEACLAWANDVALLAVQAALDPDVDPLRTQLLLVLCGCLGALKDKALQSEQAVAVRRAESGTTARLYLPDRPPIGDPLAVTAWCYFRTCGAIREVCRVGELQEEWRKRYLLLANALGTAGYLKEKHLTKELIRQARGSEGSKRR